MTIETVEQVVGLLNEYSVSEITLERNGERVCVRRAAAFPAQPPPPAASPALAAGETDISPAVDTKMSSALGVEPLLLAAPMVGLFHHLPSPLRYGTAISVGDVVGHIESMKLMNDVLAEHAGQIVEVLVEDAGAVEYGQPLFRLTP